MNESLYIHLLRSYTDAQRKGFKVGDVVFEAIFQDYLKHLGASIHPEDADHFEEKIQWAKQTLMNEIGYVPEFLNQY